MVDHAKVCNLLHFCKIVLSSLLSACRAYATRTTSVRPSVRPSVCLSICPTVGLTLMDCDHIVQQKVEMCTWIPVCQFAKADPGSYRSYLEFYWGRPVGEPVLGYRKCGVLHFGDNNFCVYNALHVSESAKLLVIANALYT